MILDNSMIKSLRSKVAEEQRKKEEEQRKNIKIAKDFFFEEENSFSSIEISEEDEEEHRNFLLSLGIVTKKDKIKEIISTKINKIRVEDFNYLFEIEEIKSIISKYKPKLTIPQRVNKNIILEIMELATEIEIEKINKNIFKVLETKSNKIRKPDLRGLEVRDDYSDIEFKEIKTNCVGVTQAPTQVFKREPLNFDKVIKLDNMGVEQVMSIEEAKIKDERKSEVEFYKERLRQRELLSKNKVSEDIDLDDIIIDSVKNKKSNEPKQEDSEEDHESDLSDIAIVTEESMQEENSEEFFDISEDELEEILEDYISERKDNFSGEISAEITEEDLEVSLSDLSTDKSENKEEATPTDYEIDSISISANSLSKNIDKIVEVPEVEEELFLEDLLGEKDEVDAILESKPKLTVNEVISKLQNEAEKDFKDLNLEIDDKNEEVYNKTTLDVLNKVNKYIEDNPDESNSDDEDLFSFSTPEKQDEIMKEVNKVRFTLNNEQEQEEKLEWDESEELIDSISSLGVEVEEDLDKLDVNEYVTQNSSIEEIEKIQMDIEIDQRVKDEILKESKKHLEEPEIKKESNSEKLNINYYEFSEGVNTAEIKEEIKLKEPTEFKSDINLISESENIDIKEISINLQDSEDFSGINLSEEDIPLELIVTKVVIDSPDSIENELLSDLRYINSQTESINNDVKEFSRIRQSLEDEFNKEKFKLGIKVDFIPSDNVIQKLDELGYSTIVDDKNCTSIVHLRVADIKTIPLREDFFEFIKLIKKSVTILSKTAMQQSIPILDENGIPRLAENELEMIKRELSNLKIEKVGNCINIDLRVKN